MSNAVAVGVFDGVHLGHVAILQRAVARARAADGRAVVVSFDPHPDLVLSRTFQAVAPLTPLPEKRERMAALGVDELEVLPFTRELAALEPEAFVARHLVGPHSPEALVVGENFALGRARAGNVERLRAIGATAGFTVEAVPLLEIEGAAVTSTRIRERLAKGEVAEAARLLGRRYSLAGLVVQGEGIGRTLGVPTANLRLHDEKLVPSNGIYAVWTRIEGAVERLPGAMSVGVRPTFGGQVRTLEVHLVDWSGDLVGRDLEVEFVDWLRPELRFESADALVAAMKDDIAETRRRLSADSIGIRSR
jgi:riboflavin kinase/FMN adenylyltransferase